ncbi:hypothetical protein AG1IA_01725 [Rhizoctonia solani AG-1 IA]|uniref:Uncharacterized protein n=1 Tax=Thanatephorus cucumeris (strain AG1-IA) TaxID=983506 RepID=L8X1S3_THACA|nr:hypothetical protein AG1IA_01725 [Rhizoctonia solani AG-1 IA]
MQQPGALCVPGGRANRYETSRKTGPAQLRHRRVKPVTWRFHLGPSPGWCRQACTCEGGRWKEKWISKPCVLAGAGVGACAGDRAFSPREIDTRNQRQRAMG